MSPRAVFWLAVALACGALFLFGCDQSKRAARDQQEVETRKRRVTWLVANDDRDPAAWLADLIHKR